MPAGSRSIMVQQANCSSLSVSTMKIMTMTISLTMMALTMMTMSPMPAGTGAKTGFNLTQFLASVGSEQAAHRPRLLTLTVLTFTLPRLVTHPKAIRIEAKLPESAAELLQISPAPHSR